ncbi:MAG: hypothetical protein HY553_17735 [Elusimicrobia bacterium]|nr:hypothetical protein [Elusimicrobiota bacterium]
MTWAPPTIEEKAAGLMMPGFKFGIDEPELAERLVDLGVGGFCLYHGAAPEVAAFTRRLQERAKLPLLFSADYEDGSAQHVEGGVHLPSNMGIGATGDPQLAFEKAAVTAAEAWAMGVRWVLAPVLDLATVPRNPIVNTRAFGSEPEAAARLAKGYCKGLASRRVLSCMKHFPGHGETTADSHLELPVLKRTRAQLAAAEMKTFKALKDVCDTAMMAHLSIPALGDKGPSSLSAKATGLLRKTLGFKKLITTDALSMQAIAAHFSDDAACVAALTAGSDVLLVPADPLKAVYGFLQRVAAEPKLHPLIAAAYKRIEQAKAACGLTEDRGIAPPDALADVGSAAHLAAADRLAAACLTWVRPEPKALPLPRAIRYLEPDADRADDWQGTAFVAELRKLGVTVSPYAPGGEGPLVVGCFLSPRAYTGRIRFSVEEERPAQTAIASDPRTVVVAFGSPFVLDDFKRYKLGLCTFSPSVASQRAAARALMAMQEAKGKMPVPLKVLKADRTGAQ